LDNNEELKLEERADIQMYLEESGFGVLVEGTKRLAVQHLLFYHLFEKRFSQLQSMRKGLNSVGLAIFLAVNQGAIEDVFPSVPAIPTLENILRHIVYDEDVPTEVREMFEQFMKDLEKNAIGMLERDICALFVHKLI
jgi:hypothetical protein